MRNFATLGLAVLILEFVSSAASAETRQFTNVNLNALGAACINAGGTYTTGKGPGGAGCKTELVDVSCDKDGNCTCTGKCTTTRQVVNPRFHRLYQTLGAVQERPAAPTGVPAPGILDSGPVFAPQGPTATGSPGAAPAAPPPVKLY